MLVKDIYEEVKEVTGLCDESQNFTALTRAVELLSNKGLFDPLIGYMNFITGADETYIALPREVKTPLRLNINKNPTFHRNRLFEFTLNTSGTEDGEEIGWNWANRGYLPIQDERRLPGNLAYLCEDPSDNGKTCTVTAKDEEGRDFTVILIANAGAPTYSEKIAFEVLKVVREETVDTCVILANEDEPQVIAQFYPDETVPNYRIIKLSKKAVSVRLMFRREIFKIRSQGDVIPLHSNMAVIHATKAVRYYAVDEYDKGDAALARAEMFLKEEQSSRDTADELAQSYESATATDANINVVDSVIVADIYDEAAEIFGSIGRAKIFDKITTAIEVLRNKAHWDSLLGVVDVWMSDRSEEINITGEKGHGYFVLPRFVESVVSLNYCGQPTIPRNKWFEFHLNGLGESSRAACGAWDYAGRTVINNLLRIDPETKRVIPVKVAALPDSAEDEFVEIVIYGTERLSSGIDKEIWRGQTRGSPIPCRVDLYTPTGGSPGIVSFDRITKGPSKHMISLVEVTQEGSEWVRGRTLGYWYPDELEPSYQMIKTSSSKSKRIRILYRKRNNKITSLFEPIHLRSRIAIINMLRAIKLQSTDPKGALLLEEMAVKYLSEEMITSGTDGGSLQFDEGVMPGLNYNVQ